MCARPESLLVEQPPIPCAEVQVAQRYAEQLAARPLTAPQRERLFEGLAARAGDDPAELRAGLKYAEAFIGSLAGQPALAQAEARSTHLWEVARGGGAFPASAFPVVHDTIETAVAIWSSSDDERLVLTEMDVEGWIRYVSLAREVQGGTPLKLSMADRVGVYRTIQDRWAALDRSGKIALGAVGPFWGSVRRAWARASYEEQQAWIRQAPLPPPMTTTSRGYLESVTGSDVAAHVRALHEALGPLLMTGQG